MRVLRMRICLCLTTKIQIIQYKLSKVKILIKGLKIQATIQDPHLLMTFIKIKEMQKKIHINPKKEKNNQVHQAATRIKIWYLFMEIQHLHTNHKANLNCQNGRIPKI